MYELESISIEPVTTTGIPGLDYAGAPRNVDTARWVKYTVRTYSESTDMWYHDHGKILVCVGYRGFRSASNNNIDDISYYETPGSRSLLYTATMVIMTRFQADKFRIVKNRWGHECAFESINGLSNNLINGRSLSIFDSHDRTTISDYITRAIAEITGHPMEYLLDRDTYILNQSIKPKTYPKKHIFNAFD